jgi:ribosome maturation factor RimP
MLARRLARWLARRLARGSGARVERRKPGIVEWQATTTAERRRVSQMGRTSDRDSVLRVLEPVVSAHGYDLEDVVITPAGKRRMLRVVIDKDGGVDLDDVARVASSVSTSLDESNAMGGTPYVLEVTSPGVDRPLSLPRHWRRSVDRLVAVGIAGVGTRTGRVLAVDDAGVDLDVDGERTRVGWTDLGQGHVQVEFTKSPSGTSAGEE